MPLFQVILLIHLLKINNNDYIICFKNFFKTGNKFFFQVRANKNAKNNISEINNSKGEQNQINIRIISFDKFANIFLKIKSTIISYSYLIFFTQKIEKSIKMIKII